VTTTRRGWRGALDSSLLFAVVVCGSASALLSAAPADIAGRSLAAASAEARATFVAPLTAAPVASTGSPESAVVDANAVAPFEPGAWSTGASESMPRDSADDDDDEDDGALEHRLCSGRAHSLETRALTHLELNLSISLESDGHSLRAPPR
jgi:hypothetical protein